jgi:hypothetical protein
VDGDLSLGQVTNMIRDPDGIIVDEIWRGLNGYQRLIFLSSRVGEVQLPRDIVSQTAQLRGVNGSQDAPAIGSPAYTGLAESTPMGLKAATRIGCTHQNS